MEYQNCLIRKKNQLIKNKIEKMFICFSLYERYRIDEGLQGCIHKFLINGKEIFFDNFQLISQNIGLNIFFCFN